MCHTNAELAECLSHLHAIECVKPRACVRLGMFKALAKTICHFDMISRTKSRKPQVTQDWLQKPTAIFWEKV